MKKIILLFILAVFVAGCTEKAAEGISKETQEKPGLQQTTDKAARETKVNRTSIGEVARTQLSELVSWADTAISMDVPAGWTVYRGGACATTSILLRNPDHPLKQIFYFSEAGPVYASQQQKESDQAYVAGGGYPILWAESPVVDPLTAENFLMHFGAFASTSLFQQAFPQVPVMRDMKIVSVQEVGKPPYAIDAKLIRAEFRQDGKEGEGSFVIMTADAGMGLGYGLMVVGMTAPKGLLDLITPSSTRSLASFAVRQAYVDSCIAAQNQAAAGALRAGKALREPSDVIMVAWEDKLTAEERISEKQSDALFSQSRLYNPETDEVYEVTPEFYGYYGVHNDQFEMSGLQEVPDDKWGYAPLNGAQYIR